MILAALRSAPELKAGVKESRTVEMTADVRLAEDAVALMQRLTGCGCSQAQAWRSCLDIPQLS